MGNCQHLLLHRCSFTLRLREHKLRFKAQVKWMPLFVCLNHYTDFAFMVVSAQKWHTNSRYLPLEEMQKGFQCTASVVSFLFMYPPCLQLPPHFSNQWQEILKICNAFESEPIAISQFSFSQFVRQLFDVCYILELDTNWKTEILRTDFSKKYIDAYSQLLNKWISVDGRGAAFSLKIPNGSLIGVSHNCLWY